MRYTIGIDFGTESGRAVIVDVATGAELGTAVHVVRQRRHRPPPAGARRRRRARARLGAPGPRRLRRDGRRRRSRDCWPRPASTRRTSSASASTSPPARCSRRPPTARRCASCRSSAASRTPGSSSGSTTPRSRRRTGSTQSRPARGEAWLPRYGGRISSEWFYAKSLQILDEAPDVYRAADRLIEAADWIVWQLTGSRPATRAPRATRRIWSKRDGFPDAAFFAGLDPRSRVDRRRQDVARHRTARARWPAGCRRRRRAGRACGRGRRRGRQRRRPRLGPGRRRTRRPGRWSR